MKTRLFLGLTTAALAMTTFTTTASARSFRPGLLPNGDENSCSNCHVNPAGGGTRTMFGEDVFANVTPGGMEFFWTAVCQMDSDGDGLTNGEEMGDPCCTWDGTGDPDRMTDVSLPGDDTSMSADPAGPDTDGDGISDACDPDPFPDMGSTDMGTTADMGGTTDMGTPTPDMGGTSDMGAGNNNTASNNSPASNNDTAGNNSSAGGNNSTSGGNNNTDSGGLDAEDDEGCGCAAAPTSSASPWLLAFALVFSRIRRRRKA